MNGSNISKLKDHLADSSRVLADLTAQMVYDNPLLFRELTVLAFGEEAPYAQRAARVVAICSLRYPELLIPFQVLIP